MNRADQEAIITTPCQWLAHAENHLASLDVRRHAVANAVDLATDLKDMDVLTRVDAVAEALIAIAPDTPQAAELSYMRANAWSARRHICKHHTDQEWDWEGEEIQRELLHLREAAYHPAFGALDPMRQCQIETNLGNLLNHVGRFVDAVACWDAALTRIPKFAMASGNRGHGLSFYARALYDCGHMEIMLLAAYDGLMAALDPDAILDNPENQNAFMGFAESRSQIGTVIDVERLRGCVSELKRTEAESPEEAAYRRWCLYHRLFLNPLNDLGVLPVADHDVLTTPDFVTDSNEPPSLLRFFNVMKQEYASARYMLYEGSNSDILHFSDRGVLLYNTLDYPSHCLAVERVKCAFRTAYSLFDKVGQFINHYWRLGVEPKKVALKHIWYVSPNKNKRKLREPFLLSPNWPLRGLFWLSRDLFDESPGFRDHTDPNAQALAVVRHRLEHGFLAVHEYAGLFDIIADGLPKDHPLQPDSNLYAMSRCELTSKALRLLQLARAALIYLSLAMHAEEQHRAGKRGGFAGIVPMDVGSWEDKWKR